MENEVKRSRECVMIGRSSKLEVHNHSNGSKTWFLVYSGSLIEMMDEEMMVRLARWLNERVNSEA